MAARLTLEDLSSISTREGPSILDTIIEIVRVKYEKSPSLKFRPGRCRLLSKKIGSAFTRVFFSRLYIRVDSCYQAPELSTTRLADFIRGFSLMLRREDQTEKPWFLSPTVFKEILFYQDPATIEMNQGSVRKKAHIELRGKVETLINTSMGNLSSEEVQDLISMCDNLEGQRVDEAFAYDLPTVYQLWYDILKVLRKMKNLESFEWHSRMPFEEFVFPTLAAKCKRLCYMNVDIDDDLLSGYESFLKRSLEQNEYKFADQLRLYHNYTTQVNDSCEVNIQLTPRTDLQACSITLMLERRFKLVDNLTINRSKSYEKEGLIDQGPGQRILPSHTLEGGPLPKKDPELRVRHLILSNVGSVSENLMSIFNKSNICSLEINSCAQLLYILLPLVRDAPLLKRFKITFSSSVKAKKRVLPYWQAYVQDMRYALDFLRTGTFELQDIEIGGQFAETDRQHSHLSQLSPDLVAAIRPHFGTLERLQVVNTDIDFRFVELAEIGMSTPLLTHLTISCRIGANLKTYDQDNEGLGWTLQRALMCFNSPKRKPFTLTLFGKGDQYHSNYDADTSEDSEDTEDDKESPEIKALWAKITAAVISVAAEGLPIVLFCYYMEAGYLAPLDQYVIYSMGRKYHNWEEDLWKGAVELDIQEDENAQFPQEDTLLKTDHTLLKMDPICLEKFYEHQKHYLAEVGLLKITPCHFVRPIESHVPGESQDDDDKDDDDDDYGEDEGEHDEVDENSSVVVE